LAEELEQLIVCELRQLSHHLAVGVEHLLGLGVWQGCRIGRHVDLSICVGVILRQIIREAATLIDPQQWI
jgi:hypothetical protein